jgi:hypothetical protein
VNREQLGRLAPAAFDAAGGGKGPNHIRHLPVLAKNGVRRDARAEEKVDPLVKSHFLDFGLNDCA